MPPPGPPLLAVAGAIATLTLRRPAQRNRLETDDLHALLAHFDTVNRDEAIRVLVLTADITGQPRPVFSAGYDLGAFDGSVDAAAQLGEHAQSGPGLFERVANALAMLRPITVGAINGSVYGGANDLVLACDLAVGLVGTELRMPAAALGLHYYPSGLQRYVAKLGPAGAKEAFLTARALSAERMQQLGAFTALAAATDFDAVVGALVQDAVALAPLAAQAIKRSINEIAAGQPDLAAMREREIRSAGSADFAEGRAAVREKRAPRFVGR